MKTQSADRTGVLILRLWIEAHQTGLRARITQSLGSIVTEESVAVAASCEDIGAVVNQWVDDFAARRSRDGNGESTAGSGGEGC